MEHTKKKREQDIHVDLVEVGQLDVSWFWSFLLKDCQVITGFGPINNGVGYRDIVVILRSISGK